MNLKNVEQALRKTSTSGARDALLVLGNGIHLQAAREAGLSDPDPWPTVIRRVARMAGIRDVSTLPSREPALWDTLTKNASAALNLDLAATGQQLRAQLVQQLVEVEKRRRTLSLYERIHHLNFENILSFNIDRTIALNANGDSFVPEESWHWDSRLPRFYRHDVVSRGAGSVTRVWYAYGNTLGDFPILLGTGGYSSQLQDLEDERGPMMRDWVEYRVASYSWPGAKPHTKLKTIGEFYEECQKGPRRSWYRLFFAAPLVIVGASLPIEDWPLWWLLHQRARGHTPFPLVEVAPTYLLAVEGEILPHLAGRPCEIEVIEFPSYEALWTFVLRN